MSGVKTKLDEENQHTKEILTTNVSDIKFNLYPNFSEKIKFKIYIKKNIDKTKFRQIRIGILSILFDYWMNFKNEGMLIDFRWVITRKFFDSDIKWENYYKNVKKYNYFNSNISSLENGIYFSEMFCEYLHRNFKIFYNECMNRQKPSSFIIDNAYTDDEPENISSFYTLNEYKKECPDDYDYKTINVDKDEIFIPKYEFTSDDLCNIICQTNPKRPKFLMNKNLEETDFNINKTNTLSRVKIKVLNKVKLQDGEGISVIGNYELSCPMCSNIIKMLPHEMNSTTYKHKKCPIIIKEDGTLGNSPISKKSWNPGKSIEIHCYQIQTFKGKNILNKDDRFFFSIEDNIKSGIYYVDVVNLNGSLISPEDKSIKSIIFGIESAVPKIVKDRFVVGSSDLLTKKFKCDNHKLLDIFQGIIDFYKFEKATNFIPEKGGLVSLFSLFSVVSKNIFGYRHFPITIIGSGSISKTYPVSLMCSLIDIDYKYTSGENAQSFPGIYGGINNNVMIGNKRLSVFQEGAVASGMVLFDESEHFFDLNNQNKFNNNLKSLHENTLNIMKVGGRDINQNWTPIFFSNFIHKHNSLEQGKNKSYLMNVRESYLEFNNRSDEFHGSTKRECYKYISKQNLFKPLQYYDNENLIKAISYARNFIEGQDLCWWSFGSLPSQNRFLFDCVVKNDIEEKEDPYSTQSEDTDEVDVINLPTQDMVLSIKRFIFGDENTSISLHNHDLNTEIVNKQIKKLRINIIDFLKEEEELIVHFKNGKRIDIKIQNHIINFFMILQLINDYNSISLDIRTIGLGKKMLLKCKRGVTEDEYNFTEHSYKPNKNIIENEDFGSFNLMNDMEDYNQKKIEIDNFKNIQKEIDKKFKKLEEKENHLSIEVETSTDDIKKENTNVKDKLEEEFDVN